MSSSAEPPRHVMIGSVRFEPESGDLAGPAGTTRLAPQPARLLGLLVEHADRVVSRDEIAGLLWPHGSVEVDQGIGYAIREVRKALEAAGGDPADIETIPRRGFRLRAAAPVPESAPAPKRRAGGAYLAVVLAFAAVSLVLLTRRPEPSVPVLVIFQHRTGGDSASESVARQVGAELTTRAFERGARRFGVIGPTGTTTLAGPDDTETARAELGACAIVSGGLRVAPDTGVVVFTQLVRTSDRVHVWASTDTVAAGAPVPRIVETILDGIESPMAQCAP